jgi:CRISPR/Cas system endoribonuclease Cas6 (RAMP superfamily)
MLHGALIRALPEQTATAMHEMRMRPFSQYVEAISDTAICWHIGLAGEMTEEIERAISAITAVQVEGKAMLAVVETHREAITEKHFADRFMSSPQYRHQYTMQIKTPCTHKSMGQYALFPSMELIYHNLFMRASAMRDLAPLFEPLDAAQFAQRASIERYALRSAPYFFERTKVVGYTGSLNLCLHGAEEEKRLAGLLLSLAEYTGIGIKTALGMGGCEVR